MKHMDQNRKIHLILKVLVKVQYSLLQGKICSENKTKKKKKILEWIIVAASKMFLGLSRKLKAK